MAQKDPKLELYKDQYEATWSKFDSGRRAEAFQSCRNLLRKSDLPTLYQAGLNLVLSYSSYGRIQHAVKALDLLLDLRKHPATSPVQIGSLENMIRRTRLALAEAKQDGKAKPKVAKEAGQQPAGGGRSAAEINELLDMLAAIGRVSESATGTGSDAEEDEDTDDDEGMEVLIFEKPIEETVGVPGLRTAPQ